MDLLKYTKLLNALEYKDYKIDIENGTITSFETVFTGKKIGSIDKKTGYAKVKINDSQYYIHDVIAIAAGWNLEKHKIQHIDGNKLNNSIHNLKLIPSSHPNSNYEHSYEITVDVYKYENNHLTKLETVTEVINECISSKTAKRKAVEIVIEEIQPKYSTPIHCFVTESKRIK